MRFEKVTAEAFGVLDGAQLELAPGMTVVYGPNESGKSTWHAALYAALCGQRRGRGTPSRKEREFRERHQPWNGASWSVSCRVHLADGRRIEIRQDLAARVGKAESVESGVRDVFGEIEHEGMPDGARFLGLDRDSFLATACVCQADILRVAEEAGELQDHLQRAAASAGSDRTAAEALERIEEFRRQQVGQLRRNSTRPLQLATEALREAEQELAAARTAHQRYLELAEHALDSEREVECVQEEVQVLELLAAEARLEELVAREQRMDELRARFPHGEPAPLETDDELALEVNTALTAFRERPPARLIDGTGAAELREELAALPEFPDGDREVHATVTEARQGLERARERVRLHREVEPERGARSATPTPREWRLRWQLYAAFLMGAAALVMAFFQPVVALFLLVASALVAIAPLNGLGRRGAELAAARERHGEWEARVAQFDGERATASGALARALTGRGLEAADDGDAAISAALARYSRACLDRADEARQASRRPDLENRIEQRERIESTAREQEQRHHDAVNRLLGTVQACGLNGVDLDDLHAVTNALEHWLEQRSGRLAEHEQQRRDWAELEMLERTAASGAAADAADPQAVRAQVAALSEGLDPEVVERGRDAPGEDRTRRASQRRKLQAAKDRRSELRGELRQFGADLPAVADAEERARVAREERARLSRLDEVLERTRTHLLAAQERVHRDLAPILCETVAPWLPRITAGRYHELRIDPRTLSVHVRDDVGEWREATQLSHGTTEQLYLLLRVALAQHLTSDGETCPLILDDVLVQCDPERSSAFLDLLHELSAGRQVVFFSQEQDVLAWARTTLGNNDRLVELP